MRSRRASVETPWMRGGLGEERYAATVASYKARATWPR
jgi:hypothetical protein